MRKLWSILLVFTLVVMCFPCCAMEIESESKGYLTEDVDEGNFEEEEYPLLTDTLEKMQDTFVTEEQTIDNGVVEKEYDEYLNKLEGLKQKNEGEIEGTGISKEEIRLFSSAYSISFYPDTIIPTYTYVTGRILDSIYSDGTTDYTGYYYVYNVDEYFDYIDYLRICCDWTIFNTEEATDQSYGTIYMTKEDGSFLAITANFQYGFTMILYCPVKSISLNQNSCSMIVDNQYMLRTTISPGDATDKSVIWISSNSSVASVSPEGVVTAKKAGTATITAQTLNGKKATCSVTVKNLVLEYYPKTIIPTYTCITASNCLGFEENNNIMWNYYSLDSQSHAGYINYLVLKDGWTWLGDETDEDESYVIMYYEKNNTSLYLVADFANNITAVGYEKPLVLATGISLDISGRTMVVGNQYTLQATIYPADATDQTITWSSSNSSVASVSADGVVTAKAVGTATITAQTSNGKKAVCSVTVKKLVLEYYPNTIIPTYTCITAKNLVNYAEYEGENLVCYDYLFDYESHTDYEAYLVNKDGWTFLDEEATDDLNYYMAYYGKNNTVLIVVADYENNVTSIAYAKPEIFATKVSLNTTGRTMIVGNQYTLNATIYPTDTTDKTITWSSSNSRVASVSADGVVTAKAEGTATITAETSNGKTASCTVLVKKLVLEYYDEENIPTFSCITGKPLTKYREEDGLRIYEYHLDEGSHTDYEAYLVSRGGWIMTTDETADDQSYHSTTYKKNNTSVIVVADFEKNVSRVMFADSRILTKTIREGNEFTVIATEVPAGSKVIFACYDGKIMTDVQSCVYRGEGHLTFTATQKYNKAKIFVWENRDTMRAVAPPETITR